MITKDQSNYTKYIRSLSDFIIREYGIYAVSIIPAKRGYYGETWRLDTKSESYFLKLDYSPAHQVKYRNSLEVVEYLCDSGIDYIGNIIKSQTGSLFSIFKSAILVVFTWIDGENIETDETKMAEYKLLSKIYALTKRGFNIPSAEFSNKAALSFFAKWDKLKAGPLSEEKRAIQEIFNKNKDSMEHYLVRLSHFAEICQKEKSHFYFTHGDAGGNLLTNKDTCFIIDWDEVMYAPLERDAWVMCCHNWALRAFAGALRQNGISYELRPERLAFYCYHMFFLYLDEFLNDFTMHNKRQEIEDYFGCWIVERLHYADTIQ